MRQFIKFATTDPEGFCLINAEDIIGIASTSQENVCRLITSRDEHLVYGTYNVFEEMFSSWFGSTWEGVPTPEIPE